MAEWPKISIITPSYNQGDFIEDTIRSVLSQDYPNLEYIIVDGCSTDSTLEILQAYQDQLTWISEPDRGQTEAINKGLKMASGEVLAYLNSDDLYLPGALHKVGAYFAENPHANWLSGYCQNIDGNGHPIRRLIRIYKNFWLHTRSTRALLVLNFIAQPATFWRRCVTENIGPLDEDLYYTLEYDYWLRIGRANKLHIIKKDLAAFRLHDSSKSGRTAFQQFDEELVVAKRYASGLPIALHQLHANFQVFIYRNILRVGRRVGRHTAD